MSKPTIGIINGSISGRDGNTAELLDLAIKLISPSASTVKIDLSQTKNFNSLLSQLDGCHAYIFGTGTYWDSWGSPLQRFLETMSETEGSSLWLGKPCGVIVTMHAVGGKGILSRLQGVLNTYGMLVPPMSGFVYSAANQLALQAENSEMTDDLWRPADIEILCHNVLEACGTGKQWKSWPVDSKDFRNKWLVTT